MGKHKPTIPLRTITISAIFLFLVELMAPLPALGQGPTSQEIFEKIEALAETTGGYQADFVDIDTRKNERRVMKGKMKKKSLNTRWVELRRGKDDSLIGYAISNGVTKWIYDPEHKSAIKQSVQRKEWIDKQSVRYLRAEFFSGEEVYVISAKGNARIPAEHIASFDREEFYIGTEDGIIRQAIQYDHDGQIKGTQIFFNIRPDPTITEEDFDFEPPPGTRVVDWEGPKTPWWRKLLGAE